MITTTKLSKKYGGTAVLNIEQLEIPKGQSFGLVGNNGAGKTTYFNLLLDLIKPTTGKITNNGVQVDTSEDWKPYTAAFIDESFLIGYLTPEEYFYFIGELRGKNKADIDTFVLQFNEIFNDEILNKKKYLRDLSKGNQKKAGIFRANRRQTLWGEIRQEHTHLHRRVTGPENNKNFFFKRRHVFVN